ncbi:FAD-dependent oxidoreductase [Nostoc sp. MS1]|uniref:FAD-dependent oxidoreductase n=1 Tax=Nostoc sp. MS1 TaxID=2764711 RepID=UPI001CC3FED5|nr:FAD-dependent oxidoreductase [Nostoc sp. MS1]BCL37591.1 pyridine nucleotide-disulfide oxidoreductase [Nostoc sp. MS1]
MQQNLQRLHHSLVLVGGGHSHAIILKMLGMKPLPEVRLTLVSPASDTPYSGMLPGHIAGVYGRDECHINLQKLANFAQAQFCIDKVVDLDLINRKVICANHPAVDFDFLSIDIGSTPATLSVSGAAEYAVPAKPVSQLLEHWYRVVDSVTQNPHIKINIAIAGGGAGGVELALSMQAHLQRILKQAQQPLSNLEIHLFHRRPELMSHHHPSVQRQIKQVLIQRGVKLHLEQTVCEITPVSESLEIKCESGLTIKCNKIFWVTQASAPQWVETTGLATDERGFILVNDTLQSLTHPEVFAAGDIATMINHPRPKAGVFAVRQGKPLYENLKRMVQGQPLKPYIPQQQYLSLIGTGDGKAIATRGSITLPPHPLLWQWKDWLDRRFMQQFEGLGR